MCTGGQCEKAKGGPREPVSCPCPKTGCEFHGICCQCVAAHIKNGKKPPHCLMFFFKDNKPGG